MVFASKNGNLQVLGALMRGESPELLADFVSSRVRLEERNGTVTVFEANKKGHFEVLFGAT